jgi:hypothetical protein
MISTKNPFPGMNPYLEPHWPDVHTNLISYIRDAITAALPPDLRARAEEQVAVSDEDKTPIYRADVAVSEAWKKGLPNEWSPDQKQTPGVTITEPEIVAIEPDTLRWIEVRERSGKLVTVIEILSKANKVERGTSAYIQKQQDYLQAGVSLVEIDFLRTGSHVVVVPKESLRPSDSTQYVICVSRAALPERCELYSCPLRKRLPAIRIPLRPTDRDILLDLQPLIDRCYENGRYEQTNFDEPLNPTPEPEELDWLKEQLHAAGLIDQSTS